MRRSRPLLAAVTLTAAALALLRPRLAARALCAATGPHAYIWTEPAAGGPAHLACLGCGAVPRMLASVEPARAGCHGCHDCVCRREAWPARVERVAGP